MTQTRIEALEELAAKVEAGKWWNDIGICSSFCAKAGFTGRQATLMTNAMHSGSLDAAKALHDAVLPGWGWRKDHFDGSKARFDGSTFWVTYPGKWRVGHTSKYTDGNDARAWLLAILRALIEQEKA